MTASPTRCFEVSTSGGKPANRYSLLNHDFHFDVAGGDQVTFFVKARKSFMGTENENFQFLYNTSGSSYSPMFEIGHQPVPSG